LEFIDYLRERAANATDTPTQARTLAERMWVFIQQYDHLRDDLQAMGRTDEPSVEDYAERWGMPIRSAHRAYAEFTALFPSEQNAGRLCDELWDGIGRQAGRTGRLMPVGAVVVVPS
jgi:hypothetical protein